jgi:transglutaminase-like putative cysteine protease
MNGQLRIPCFALATFLALIAPSTAWSADAPAWLSDAAKIERSPIERNAPAVVLRDEQRVTVSADGRVVTHRTYAVRVQTRAGAEAASVREVYVKGSGEVRSIRAWILADGRTTQLSTSDVVDVALVNNDLFNEVRAKVVSAPESIPPGTIFGAETDTLDRTVFTQFEWPAQEEWPVRQFVRALTLPSGWDARTVTFNHAPIEPQRAGATWTWTAADLPSPPQEPAGPPLSGLVPRIAVTYSEGPASPTAFTNWESVSTWLSGLQDAQASATPALTAKARELTASTATPLEQIAAIGRYVQKVQYISIQTGLGRGGGYKPHAASNVLSKNYGDCKDKANLMRALLGSIGINAHLVAIYSGDPFYVRPEWPSPQQFNHAIVAVDVAPETHLAAVTTVPKMGTLLLFDPTDEQTPVGQLPLYLQDSFGLVVMPKGGDLIKAPSSSPEANVSIRMVKASVTRDGLFKATVTEQSSGDAASRERWIFTSLSREAYKRRLEAELRRQVPGAVFTLGNAREDTANNLFERTVQLEARGFAQVLQNRLLLVRAPLSGREALPALTAAERQTPVVLDALEERDRFELEIPTGAAVDEMPKPISRDSPFGRFAVEWKAQGGIVVRDLALRLTRESIPPQRYGELRTFLDAESQPIVLTRP